MDTYRQDIDGLRAFAVLAVIVNHADPMALSSGFLGVDVFFVISGYVIALSLMGNASQPIGGFLRGFYTRRIKRLMPGLILCVAASSAVLLAIDTNPEVSLRTGAGALFGVANIYLYFQQLDYFAADIGFNAFTHTWSLGIEEQFYLLLPALFWWGLRARSPGLLLGGIVLLSGLSFAAFLALRDTQPIASFYLLHTRFWELGAGVALALLFNSRPEATPAPQSSGVWIGWQGLFLLGLLGSLALAEPDGRVMTALVVVLTMMLIAAPDRTWLLQNPVAVYLGRISYTLYLWHWPLLVFQRLAPDASWTQPAPLIGGLFGASILSYHLVEQPLRHRPWSSGQRWDVPYGLAASGVLAVALIVTPKPAPAPSLDSLMAMETFNLPLPSGDDPYDPTCVVDDGRRPLRDDTFERCTFPPDAGSDAPMIWAMGDSHAGHFQGLLVKLHQKHGIGFHLVETVGQFFPPLPEDNPTSRLALLDMMRDRMQPGDVVLLGRLYLTRTDPLAVREDVFDTWLPSLGTFLEEMAARSVTVVIPGPPPAFRFADIRGCARDDLQSCAVPRAPLHALVVDVERALQSLAAEHDNLRVLPVFDLLCPPAQRTCSPSRSGVFTMRDSDHLNVYGASLLEERLLEGIGFR
ncbi:MAG: acyltransferase family protein [Pelagibaca sp.]